MPSLLLIYGVGGGSGAVSGLAFPQRHGYAYLQLVIDMISQSVVVCVESEDLDSLFSCRYGLFLL